MQNHTGLKAGFLRETSHAKKLKCASQFQFAHWDICILIIFDINASIPHTAYKIGALPYELEAKKTKIEIPF